MTKCYLDSNILVYLKNADSPFHKATLSLVINLTETGVDVFLSPLAIDEFLHNFAREVKAKRITNIFEVLDKALEEILDLPKLEIVNPPIERTAQKKVVKYMEKYQLHARDAYHLLICLENNIDGFATFDKDFGKVFKAKVLEKAL